MMCDEMTFFFVQKYAHNPLDLFHEAFNCIGIHIWEFFALEHWWPGSSNPMFCGGGSSYPTGWWWFHLSPNTTPIFEPLRLYGNGMGPAVGGPAIQLVT